MLSVADFRAIFPEFGDTTLYPDARVNFNLTLAYDSLNPAVWGSRLDAAAGYYTAHLLVMAGAAPVAGGGGSTSGAVTSGGALGLISSKSIGGVAVTYDTTASTVAGQGSLNLTRYGQQYLSLAASIAAGPMQF